LAKTFSVIIPVLHETEGINALIDHLQSLERSEEMEFVVVDGDPDGGTVNALQHRGIQCLRAPMGRAVQMNTGAAAATGEILIFLHADTRLPDAALNLIDQALAEQTLIGGAFDLLIDTERPLLKLVAAVASLRSRLTRIPYGDQAIFMRRTSFHQIGRFPEIPLMEDVAIMRRIKKAGGKICFIGEPVITSARRWEREGVISATLRNWLLLSAYTLGVAPETLVRYYRSENAPR
jgi:rSAM/selenodomain-associated transferase 2